MIVRTGLGFTLNFPMHHRIVSRSYLTLRTGYVYKLVPLDGYHRYFVMPSNAGLCYYSDLSRLIVHSFLSDER